jgi:hypothetical protein
MILMPKTRIRVTATVCLLAAQLLWALVAQGDVLRYSAAGTAAIKKAKPSAEESTEALNNAKRTLLAKVIADQDTTRRERLGEMISSLNPDDYFVSGSLVIADTRIDPKVKVLTLVAQADVDSDRFNKVLDQGTAKAAAAGEQKFVAWVFAARRQASVKEYEPETFNRVTTQEKVENAASAKAAGGGAETSEAQTKQSSASSSGGVLRKSDNIEYIVAEEQRARIDKALSSVLVSRGLKPVPSSDLQVNSGGKLKISAVMEDFKTATDISDDNKALVMNAALSAEVDYFATGTVTINAKSRDGTTGKTRIAATVDAQILGFRKSRKGDRYVGSFVAASTGSKVVIAIGTDQTEAENKAIEEASTIAGNILCDQIR